MTTLNVASVHAGTRALGPGLRAVVWVQGCPFDCPGCVAPEWIPDRPATLVPVAELADRLCVAPEVDGLTLSGGEPMTQAAGLAELVDRIRGRRDVSVLCFTGHRLERLRREPGPGVADLLARVDTLIDGRYVAALNDGRGLRGSRNQRIHHLTDRLRSTGFDFEETGRRVEITVGSGAARLTGVPTAAALAAYESALAGTAPDPRATGGTA